MKTIKEELDSLPKEQKQQLMYAFEHGLSQYVHLPENRFVGVNVKGVKHLFIDQAAGVWAAGVNVGPKNKILT